MPAMLTDLKPTEPSRAKVEFHCHQTGNYSRAATNNLSINAKQPKNVPVSFHNPSGYNSLLF